MRIALVSPVARRSQGYHTIGTYIPQLGLQVLADLVPDGHEVDIIDEVFGTEATDELLRRGGYDLVGITSYTSGATRAYEIAAGCRKLGIPTIMGGPHAWACPDETAQHVDSVATGECDEIWPEIVREAAAGRLQPRYAGRWPDLEKTGLGRGRQALQPINGQYDVSAIQTSRGCPVGCEYCSVTKFNGPQIRRRDIGEIIAEWNATPRKFIFVVDDNFFGVGPQHAAWAKELLRALIKHGKRRLWFSQTTINMGEDHEGLTLAYKAGCRGMLVGIETFNERALKAYHKGLNRKNLARFQELIDGFHRAGVSVFGGFIVGSDEDTPDAPADTVLTATKMGVDIIQMTNLTPLPGTKMFERLKAEGRLLATNWPADWERYNVRGDRVPAEAHDGARTGRSHLRAALWGGVRPLVALQARVPHAGADPVAEHRGVCVRHEPRLEEHGQDPGAARCGALRPGTPGLAADAAGVGHVPAAFVESRRVAAGAERAAGAAGGAVAHRGRSVGGGLGLRAAQVPGTGLNLLVGEV